MAEKEEAETLDVRDVPTTEPGRLGKIDKLIVYQVGPFRRYSVRIPEEDLTKEKLKEAVRADWAERKRWIGIKITL